MRFLDLKYRIVGALVCAWLPIASVSAQSSDPPGDTLSADDLFDGSQLQDIWIHINARDWERLLNAYLEGAYYPTDFEWHGVRVRNAGIRVRGRLSRSDHKPSLRVDFNRYVTGQEFLGLKSLVLNNEWQDPSMIRERLSMLVFRRMGLPAPRESHARVYIGSNREYAGVYTVVESIDQAFLVHNFNENDGHLYEYHWHEPYGFQDPGSNLDWYASRFEPKTHETESTAVLFTPIRDLVQAINDARQSQLEDKIEPYLNLKVYITHIAIENFLSQKDGLLGDFGMNNFYLYRFEAKRMSQLIPWDQDLAFASMDTPPWQHMDTNVLATKIWDVPELRQVYLRTLLEVARSADAPAGGFDAEDPSTRLCSVPDGEPPCGWLEEEVLREYAQIREAALADPLTPYSNEQFEQSMEFLRAFARHRGNVVREYVARLAPDLAAASRRR